ncbi:hypothetical protein AAFF_G00091880 [Aldrovandia affinis]|uniref:Uncharacterized protein n=1 Tax=Aldrovandia affinis TaxID=143900 RepID=A0AAD7T2G0_9TELE|nr:hypothetical protein AAFF_G00091880 [Aldrovandia affinis]
MPGPYDTCAGADRVTRTWAMKAFPNDRACEVYSVSNSHLCLHSSPPAQGAVREPPWSRASGDDGVFYLGGSVEFTNQSFSMELSDPASPQFHLQVQAVSPYVRARRGAVRQPSLAGSLGARAFQAGVEELGGGEPEEELPLNKNIVCMIRGAVDLQS